MSERALLRSLAGAPPAAVILGNGSAHTLGFVRSLGRRGIPVAAVSVEGGPRVWSRYCRFDRVFPSEAALLDCLERLGSELPAKGVLLATGDADVLFLVKHRAPLSARFHFVVPDFDVIERLADKRFQFAHAAQLGMPVPVTFAPSSSEELRDVAASIGYPCVVKPAYSHLWREYRRQVSLRKWPKAAPAESPAELYACYREMREGGAELVVQERIDGDESRLYAAYLYLDRRSQPLASFVLRKRRQWPPVYGNGSYSVSCRQDEVLAQSVKLLQSMRYQGLANVEFKHDPKDGRFKLIEVNVRAGNRIALAIDAGVDLPYLAYRDALGEPIEPVDTYEAGVGWIDLLHDAAGFPHYRRVEGLRVRQWARDAWQAKSRPYFALDDPLPFLAHIGRTVRSAWRAGV